MFVSYKVLSDTIVEIQKVFMLNSLIPSNKSKSKWLVKYNVYRQRKTVFETDFLILIYTKEGNREFTPNILPKGKYIFGWN